MSAKRRRDLPDPGIPVAEHAIDEPVQPIAIVGKSSGGQLARDAPRYRQSNLGVLVVRKFPAEVQGHAMVLRTVEPAGKGGFDGDHIVVPPGTAVPPKTSEAYGPGLDSSFAHGHPFGRTREPISYGNGRGFVMRQPVRLAGSTMRMAAIATIAAGCAESNAPTICHPVVGFAIVVEVRDETTQPAASGVELTGRHTWKGTTITDTARTSLDGLTLIVGNLPGEYALTMKKPGYLTWTRSQVVPAKDAACGLPSTVRITAQLTPSPKQ